MAVSAKFLLRNIVLVTACLSMVASFEKVKQNSKKGIKVTRETWPELTLGKRVMLYFYYPWCDYCSDFKPTWKMLKNKYKENEDIVFLDANCEDPETDKLCTDFMVQGAPEVHWGVTTRMRNYEEIDEEDLIQLIETNLTAPICSIQELDSCPKSVRDDMSAIDKMTTSYLEKIAAMKYDDKFKVASGVVKKHGITNKFWHDISDIEYIYGTTDEPINPFGENHEEGMSSAISLEEQMAEYEAQMAGEL